MRNKTIEGRAVTGYRIEVRIFPETHDAESGIGPDEAKRLQAIERQHAAVVSVAITSELVSSLIDPSNMGELLAASVRSSWMRFVAEQMRWPERSKGVGDGGGKAAGT